MTPGEQVVLTIVTAVLASSGLWALIGNIWLKHSQNKSAVAVALQCLLRDRILQCERQYKEAGYCDPDDKTNVEHMFKAYQNLGGNDVAHKAYNEIMDLPSFPSATKES